MTDDLTQSVESLAAALEDLRTDIARVLTELRSRLAELDARTDEHADQLTDLLARVESLEVAGG